MTIAPRLLIAFVVLVDGGRLGSRSIRIEEQSNVQLQRPGLAINVGEDASGIVRGHNGMDGGSLINILFVKRRSDLEVLKV